MLEHNSLSLRLNAVRNGEKIPAPPLPPKPIAQNPQTQGSAIMTYKQFFINEVYKLFNVLSASTLYGFGIKAIAKADWNFIELLGVGFLLNHFLTILLKSKLFRK